MAIQLCTLIGRQCSFLAESLACSLRCYRKSLSITSHVVFSHCNGRTVLPFRDSATECVGCNFLCLFLLCLRNLQEQPSCRREETLRYCTFAASVASVRCCTEVNNTSSTSYARTERRAPTAQWHSC